MSSYDPRGWGHSPKELVALSPPSNMVGIDQPDCDAGELTFQWFFLPRLLTPRRDNPRVEWMLSHSYECFLVHFGDYMPKSPLPGQRSDGIAAKDLRVEERMRNRLRKPTKLLLEILCIFVKHTSF